MDKKRLSTFVLGGLTGVAAGILLAPKSGRETRGTLANRAGEARQRGRESYFDTRERFGERFSARKDAPARNKHVERTAPRKVPPKTGQEEPKAPEPGRPHLRDVSRGASDGAQEEGVAGEGSPSAARSEELRRKVKETRARLRSRAQEGREDAGEE